MSSFSKVYSFPFAGLLRPNCKPYGSFNKPSLPLEGSSISQFFYRFQRPSSVAPSAAFFCRRHKAFSSQTTKASFLSNCLPANRFNSNIVHDLPQLSSVAQFSPPSMAVSALLLAFPPKNMCLPNHARFS